MTFAGLIEHIEAFLYADPETSIRLELGEVFREVPANKPRKEDQISMMEPKALVWLLERGLRHLVEDKLSASEIERLSRCTQDDLLFGLWSATHLLDDNVLAVTGLFQVGGIPSRGASSGLGLRLHLAQRLDDVECLVNCFSGGDEVGLFSTGTKSVSGRMNGASKSKSPSARSLCMSRSISARLCSTFQ